MDSSRHGNPVLVREYISRLLHQRGWTRTSEYRAVFSAWERTIPESIAKRSKPVSFRSGRLIVVVSSAPLLDELRCFRSSEFLNLLNSDLGSHPESRNVVVQKLVFKSA
ncbi:MAG: hypothetical protein COB96_04890 [Planctomycetota bacterium]|nr:MAG: hypothetical protein COB96_04890 [Planctomycetota bacterium]